MSEYEGKYPKDFLGNTVAIGTKVVYPTRRGSKMWLCRGIVKDFTYHDDLSAEWKTTPWTLDIAVETLVLGSSARRVAKAVPAHRCVVV